LVGYQPEKGALRQREWASQWLQGQGIDCDAENITITCGGQHAITLALAATVRPGEHLLCEGLTYPGLSATAAQMGIKLTGLPQDEQGIVPEVLEAQCKSGNFRALYCTPIAQNPSNAKMTLKRQQAIVDIAERYNLWIIEDVISGYYCEEKPPGFYQLNPNRSLHINSHSKMLAGGLRVGYLLTPPKLNLHVSAAIRSHCWFTSPLTIEVAQRWVGTDAFALSQQRIKAQLAKRLEAAGQILADYDVTILQGSFHVWLQLPEPWRAADFAERLSDKGVAVLTSEPFAVGRFAVPQAVRICVTGPVEFEDVVKGLEIIRNELDSGLSHHLKVF
ncbi:MAG: PLP-dependent aminotransferase family protein, partial [Leucothrix sp.]